MIISKEQKTMLAEFLPSEYERLLSKGDVSAVLDALDDLYLELLDDEQEPTHESDKCEALRDSIHFSNFHKD